MTFYPIARSTDLAEGKGRPFTVEGHRIALVRVDGVVRAVGDLCPHADASIAFGQVENGCITCPWHYAEFDLRTGQVLCGPATEDIPVYAVREEDGIVSVGIEDATVESEQSAEKH